MAMIHGSLKKICIMGEQTRGEDLRLTKSEDGFLLPPGKLQVILLVTEMGLKPCTFSAAL
jgi:hypothetical protein